MGPSHFVGATLLFASLLVVPPEGRAACKQWDLKGLTQFTRSDGVLISIKDVRQRGSQLTGRSGWSSHIARSVGQTDSLEGTVVGDRVTFRIYPADPTKASSYSGRISGTGRVEGTAEVWIRKGLRDEMKWSSDAGAARCPAAMNAAKVAEPARGVQPTPPNVMRAKVKEQ